MEDMDFIQLKKTSLCHIKEVTFPNKMMNYCHTYSTYICTHNVQCMMVSEIFLIWEVLNNCWSGQSWQTFMTGVGLLTVSVMWCVAHMSRNLAGSWRLWVHIPPDLELQCYIYSNNRNIIWYQLLSHVTKKLTKT